MEVSQLSYRNDRAYFSKLIQLILFGQMEILPMISGTKNFWDRIALKYVIKRTSLKNLKMPKKTKLMMNVGSPEIAFESSFILILALSA